MSSFYTSKTNNTLSQNASLSILSSTIPPEAYEALAKCWNPEVKDVDIIVQPGAAAQTKFQGTIKWHPSRPVVHPGTDREVSLVITNGKVLTGDKAKINDHETTPFQIDRPNLDLPLYLTAYVDKQASKQLEFPARPKSTMVVALNTKVSDKLRRSGHYGPEAFTTAPYCIVPQHGGVLLPSTAAVQKASGGYEHDGRTAVRVTSKTPLQVCMVVESKGVPGAEEKYGHEVTGTLTVAEAYLQDIKY
jgi:hypothetical protein